MEIETHQTNRLTLRKLTPEIYKLLFSNYTQAEIKKIVGCNSEEEYLKLKAKVDGGMATHNLSFAFFQLVESSTNSILGSCVFHNWRVDHNRSELGYHLEKDEFKQKGFMSEALEFVIRYGFTEMNLHRI